MSGNGMPRLIDSVQPPSPSAGMVTEIVAGPGETLVLTAWRAKPCESSLYRFSLTDDGHAKGLTPVAGGVIPALVAGLAISPDGRRIAYATAPCGDDPPNASSTAVYPPSVAKSATATLNVLNTATGNRRMWTADRASVIGEIVWARDNSTLGYTIGDVIGDDAVGDVEVRALDTDAPGADLFAGRVLFRSPAGAGTVTAAVMDPDGRTGYGVMQKGEPASTILFSFTEGKPTRVTQTIPPDPDGTLTSVAFSTSGEPRYACLSGGLDAFGRVSEGTFATGSRRYGACEIAYEPPF